VPRAARFGIAASLAALLVLALFWIGRAVPLPVDRQQRPVVVKEGAPATAAAPGRRDEH
jgi:hypothetical protein